MRLLAIEQKDGTYFIRPFGELPFVCHADKLVTGRLIKFYRNFNSWVFWGALLLGALSLPILLNFWSDDLLLATVIFMIGTWAVVAAGAIAGALVILRHASRVPATVFPTPKLKAEPAHWRLLRVAATVAAALLLVGPFYAPEHLPFLAWEWIEMALIAIALLVFVADHLRRQREQSGKPPPIKIDDRAEQRRRIFWGTLLGPLANPLALWFAARLLLSDELEVTDNTFRIFELLLGPSYSVGSVFGLCLLLGLGRTGVRWYLVAATVAALLMAPLWFYFFEPYFSPELRMGSALLWLSTTTAAFVAYPMAIAFWLIARPDRWAQDVDSSDAAGQSA